MLFNISVFIRIKCKINCFSLMYDIKENCYELKEFSIGNSTSVSNNEH